MSVRQVSKYPESSSRTSSASRDSESVVNPTRSANSTETRRRSAMADRGTGSARSRAGEAGAGPAPPSAAPHSPQTLCPGGFAEPQAEHVTCSGEPHSPQNFCPTGFSAPQLEQTTYMPSGITLAPPGEASRHPGALAQGHQEGTSARAASTRARGLDRPWNAMQPFVQGGEQQSALGGARDARLATETREWVGGGGFEPPTSSVSGKRSPPELTARSGQCSRRAGGWLWRLAGVGGGDRN